jgi:hypothetical protein
MATYYSTENVPKYNCEQQGAPVYPRNVGYLRVREKQILTS